MTAVLAVDLGKTGCRAALWTEDAQAPILSRAGVGAPGLAAADGVDASCAAVVEVCASLLRDAGGTSVPVVCVGAAGASTARPAARELGERLLGALPIGEVAVCSDSITSHAGALGAGPGVVLAAGTGSVAIGLSRSGQLVRVDGWGPVLGDEGSGSWIGVAGLRAALRSYDGRGPDTGLRQAAVSMFGELDRLPGAMGDNPARVAARFVPEVARLCAAGDAVAFRIMRAAAEALAEAVITAGRRLGEPVIPVAITGGLAEVGPALLDPLSRALAAAGAGLRLQRALGGSLDGARLLASRHDTAHERYLERAGGAGRTAVR